MCEALWPWGFQSFSIFTYTLGPIKNFNIQTYIFRRPSQLCWGASNSLILREDFREAQLAFWAIECCYTIFLNLFETFWIFLILLDSFGIFWNLLESFGIFWNLLESFGIFWNLLESFRIFWNLLESFWNLLESFWIFLESFGIVWNFWAAWSA